MADTIKTSKSIGFVIQGWKKVDLNKVTKTYELPNPVDNLDETIIRNNTTWLFTVAANDKKFNIITNDPDYSPVMTGAYTELKTVVDLDLTGV